MAPAEPLADQGGESASLLRHQPSEEANSQPNTNGDTEEPLRNQTPPVAAAAPKTASLDRLGAEVTAIVTPVSICMLLVVVLVRFLQLEHDDDSNAQTAPSVADLYYQEHTGDSNGKKFRGAAVNSLIFICAIAFLTFCLFLLFKYRCMKIIYGYMGFSGFVIYSYFGGAVLAQICLKINIAIDNVSFVIIIYNFAIAGLLTLFFLPSPINFKQGNLIFIAVVVAHWFTKIPEWTTFLLLIAISLYDLCAVLSPGGPLKGLVELAEEREEDLPALVYEARPIAADADMEESSVSQSENTTMTAEQERRARERRKWQARKEQRGKSKGANGSTSKSQRPVSSPQSASAKEERHARRTRKPKDKDKNATESLLGGCDDEEGDDLSNRPGQSIEGEGAAASWSVSDTQREREEGKSDMNVEIELTPVNTDDDMDEEHQRERNSQAEQNNGNDRQVPQQQSGSTTIVPDGIKLGLGDFVFYSVLVGRAALYDLTTAVACYVAIIAGLGMTLLLLIMADKALPALPISIFLGIIFYFGSRALLEPFTLSLATEFLYF